MRLLLLLLLFVAVALLVGRLCVREGWGDAGSQRQQKNIKTEIR